MRRERERLLDIIEYIDKLLPFAARGKRAFLKDEAVQEAIIYRIQCIGEAASKLPADFRTANPQIPWRRIMDMRIILVHHYFDVDLDEIWQVIRKDLPPLRIQIQTILDSLDP